MQNYRVQINDVNQDLYETFKQVLAENNVPTTGHLSILNAVKNIIFEKGLESFNSNPQKYLKELHSNNET
ncbi:MAG: hypothetical protein KOO69_03125 [Victivallales bacterium]|nr:hypothetical protein [Victivallales bacterium]